jgi:hypothetical protein
MGGETGEGRHKIEKHPEIKPKHLPLKPEQARCVFFIQIEKILNTLGFIGERLGAVAMVYGFIEFLVGLYQRRGHGQRIVQIGETAAGKLLPGIQHLLRGPLYRLFLLLRGILRPGEIVVNDCV